MPFRKILSETLNEARLRFVPFLAWTGELKDPAILRADIIAGTTVALVLIPQAMAYAQLAGLPPHSFNSIQHNTPEESQTQHKHRS